MSPTLENTAEKHARYLLEIDRLDHRGPGGETLADRLLRAGYDFQRAGENLAWGTPTPSVVLSLWLESEGHRETLMEPAYVEAGISRLGEGDDSYWVLVMGVPRE